MLDEIAAEFGCQLTPRQQLECHMFSVGGIENFPSGELIDELICRWFCKYSHLIKERGAKTKWSKFSFEVDRSLERLPSIANSSRGPS